MINSTLIWKEFPWNMPLYSGKYLVITSSGWVTTLEYNKEEEKFNYDPITEDYIEVFYWAEFSKETKDLVNKVLDKMEEEYDNA